MPSAPVQLENMPPSTGSVEASLGELDPPQGYPEIATFMGKRPEMAMVRRFRGLNARNLLYLQAELVQVENDLLKCEKEDANESSTKYYATNYAWLVRKKEGNRQWELIENMREKLKQYNDVLIQQTTLANISNPSKYDAATMREWYMRKDLQDMPLEGDDASIWAHPKRITDGKDVSRHHRDLIAISGASTDLDRTTTWLIEKVIPNWHLKKDDISTFRESSVYFATSVIATTLSSLLPILSIVVLYLVHDMGVRLGIIAAFTAAFSFALSVITSANRVENFATTAAFAAVQVVFVGTNGNGTSGG